MYSFDISYPLIDDIGKFNLSDITNKYKCVCYASDCGTLSTQKDPVRSFGYTINSLQDIVELDKELNSLNDHLFIPFITRRLDDNDCEHIFYHPDYFKNIIQSSKNAYIDIITNHLSEEEQKIYDYFVGKYGSCTL